MFSYVPQFKNKEKDEKMTFEKVILKSTLKFNVYRELFQHKIYSNILKLRKKIIQNIEIFINYNSLTDLSSYNGKIVPLR